MLALLLVEVAAIGSVAIGFCEHENCNFPNGFKSLIVDPFTNPVSPSIQEDVANYIMDTTNVEIYFNVNDPSNEFHFSFPLFIFSNKNLTIKKLDNQIPPNNIEFIVTNKYDYSKTGLYITNLQVKFNLIGFSPDFNLLKFNEFSYYINTMEKINIFSNNEKYIMIYSNKIGVCEEILFSFKNITLLNQTNDFVLQIMKNINADILNGEMTLCDGNDTTSVMYKMDQKICFTSLYYNSSIILSSEIVDSITKLPIICVDNIFNITLNGYWPDASIDEVKNVLSIPRKDELDLYGEIVINTTNVPFNINGYIINIYFSSIDSRIVGKVISDYETNLYIDQTKDIIVSAEILRHEKGKILVFDSNITVKIYYMQYEFEENFDMTFPVVIAFSNTEIANVKIIEIDFNQISTTVKYLSLINIMDKNPGPDMDFVLDGFNYFLNIPFVSFYYFAQLQIRYNKYSNLVHGFKNEINCLSVSYFVDYDNNVVEICTSGDPPMFIPLVLCIAGDKGDCNKIGLSYYFVDDSANLSCNKYVSKEFLLYDVYVFTNNITNIGLSTLSTMNYYFQFFLNGAKITLKLPENKESIYNLTINNGIISSDTTFNCELLVLLDIKCSNNISVEFNCQEVQSDICSLSLIYRSKHVEMLNIVNPKDLSYVIDITNEDLIIDDYKISWSLVDQINITGYEFILNNHATNISGFELDAVAPDTVIQFNGDYKELFIQNNIVFNANRFSTIIYIYQPYLNPNIIFQLGSKYQYVLSYMDIVSYCVYVKDDASTVVCPDSYIRKSYLELNSCAETNATRVEIYFNDNFPASNVYAYIDLNLFNSKELYFFCSNGFIRLNVTVPNDTIDLEYTSVTFHNFKVYVNYDYEGQQISTTFGYLTLMGSAFMNAGNVSVVVDHFYGRFFNLRDWKDITISRECYLYDFNVNIPYKLYFITRQNMKDRLNLYLKDTDHDRLITFGDRKIYYNKGVYFLPEDVIFSVNIFITDPYHVIQFHCNETGTIPNLNIVFNSIGPIYFTGLWGKNYDYMIKLTIDREVQILIDSIIYMDIAGTGIPNIFCGSASCAIIGEILLTQTGEGIPVSVGIDSLYPFNTEFYIETLKYEFLEDFNTYFTAAIMLGTNVRLIINNLGYEGVEQLGYDFVYYMDNNGVSQVILNNVIDGMMLSSEINLYLNLTGNLDNEDDYKILRKNITILAATADDTYFDIDLYIMLDDNSLAHGFPQVIKLQKVDQVSPGYSKLYLYTDKSPLEVPYTIQFAIDGSFYDEIDVGISQYQKIDTAFDSVPFKIRQINFVVSSVIPINYPIKVSSIDSKYNDTTFYLTASMKSLNTIYIDEPGAGISTLMVEKIILKKEKSMFSLYSNIKNVWLNKAEIKDNALNGLSDVEMISADIDSFNKLIKTTTFSGRTSAVVRGTREIVFGEDFWFIKSDNISNNEEVKIDSNQFKSMTVEASSDVDLTIFKKINQTTISGLHISFISDNEHTVRLGNRWKHILDMSSLSFSSNNTVHLITMSRPLNCKINAPHVTVAFDSTSNEQFEISDAPISKSFEMDLTQFPPKQHVVIGETIIIQNKVEITFKDDIGQIASDNLTILNDASVSIHNISIDNILTIRPGAVLKIGELTTKNDTRIELHWNCFAFPLLAFNHSVESDNFSLILDDVDPDVDVMNELLYNKHHVIITGKFDCTKWQWKLNMVSSSPYYRSGGSNVLALQCAKIDDFWNLTLFSYKNVTIESVVQQTEESTNIGLIAGLSATAAVIVAIISVSFYYLCRDARKVRLKEQRREIREKLERKESQSLAQSQKDIKEVVSSSYDDFTSFSFSESSDIL